MAVSFSIRIPYSRLTGTNLDRVIAEWRRGILRRFATQVVPAARKKLPRRTGRLRASVRVQVQGNVARVSGLFYGAFLTPSAREVIRKEYRSQLARISRESLAEALRKYPIFGR